MQGNLSRDPEMLVFREGGTAGPYLGGALCLLLGGGVATGAWPSPLPVAFGAIFVLIGLLAMLGRSETVIDRRDRVLITSFSLLTWRWKKKLSFDDLEAIKLSAQHSKDQHWYLVETAAPRDKKGGCLFRTTDLEAAHLRAEELAGFIGISMIDETAGAPVLREAGRMDESLRERAERTGAEVELPPPPEGSRIAFSASGETLTLEVPPRPLGTGRKAGYALAAAGPVVFIAVAVLAVVYGDGGQPGAIVLGIVIAFMFLVLAPAVVFTCSYRAASKHWRVTVSPDNLRVEIRGFMRKGETILAAAEIENLTVLDVNTDTITDDASGYALGEKLILARSDKVRISFGDGLSEVEIEWLKAVIEKTLIV